MLKVLKRNVDEIIKELDEQGLVIPAISDVIFKSLFQNPKMKGVLSFIISEVTGIDKNYVYKNIRFRSSETPINNITEKYNISDLIVDIGNNIISLEMNAQNSYDTNFRNSAHFHSLIVNNIKVSDNYRNVRKIIQISFDFKRPFSKELVSEIMLMDVNTGRIDEENYKKYRVNLSKAQEKDYNNITRFERVLLLMQLDEKATLERLARKDKEFMIMVKEIEKMSANPEFVSLYDEEKLMRLSIDYAKHKAAEDGWNEGMEKGLEEGLEKGMEKGLEEGIEKGTANGIRMNKIETAKRLITKKMSIDDIVEITELDIETINSLINKNE